MEEQLATAVNIRMRFGAADERRRSFFRGRVDAALSYSTP
jgi:hypothetical protein